MQFELFTANCTGDAANCSYPNRIVVGDAATLAAAVAQDHVCATYKNNYRSKDNFLRSALGVWD